jgi:hypothetical protein
MELCFGVIQVMCVMLSSCKKVIRINVSSKIRELDISPISPEYILSLMLFIIDNPNRFWSV